MVYLHNYQKVRQNQTLRSLLVVKAGRNSSAGQGKFAGPQTAGAHFSMGPSEGSEMPFKFPGQQQQEALTAARHPRDRGDAGGQLLAGIRRICPCQVWVSCSLTKHFYVLIASHVGDSCSFSFLSKCVLPFNLWFLKLPASGSWSCEVDSCPLDWSISLTSKGNPAKTGLEHIFC